MRNLYWIFILAALYVLGSLATLSARRGDTPERSKARHFYIMGAIASAEDRGDEAYEYFKKAYQTDPTYSEAAYSLGVERLQNRYDSMLTAKGLTRSVGLMRQFVDDYPMDVQEGLYYGYIADGLGDINEAVRVYSRVDSLKPERTSTLLTLSEAEMKRQNYRAAIDYIDRYQRIEGETPELDMRKVQLTFQEGDTIAALSGVSEMIGKYPAEPRFLLLRGALYEMIGDSVKMAEDYKKAETRFPDNGRVKATLSDLALNRGDSAGYDRLTYESLLAPDLEFDDKRDILAMYIVRLLSDSADTRRGDHLFKVLSDQYPHRAELLDLEARYRYHINERPQAIELISYATDLEPQNEGYWRQLLYYQVFEERYKDAEKTYEKARGVLEPGEDFSLMAAMAFTADSLPGKALAIYQDVLKDYIGTTDLTIPLKEMRPRPDIASGDMDRLAGIYCSAGDALFQSGEKEKAFAAYDNALYLDPENILTLNNYAYFLCESGGDLEKALSMISKVIAEGTENPTYLDTYAWILYKLGRPEEGLEYMERAVEMLGEDVGSHPEFLEHLKEIRSAIKKKN